MNFLKKFTGMISVGILMCGCGGPTDVPELAAVKGVVMLDGAPFGNATVTFTPDSGRPSMGVTNENGLFVLTYSPSESGAKVGRHTVQISPGLDSEAEDFMLNAQSASADFPTTFESEIDLTVEVKAGKNAFAFPLISTQ